MNSELELLLIDMRQGQRAALERIGLMRSGVIEVREQTSRGWRDITSAVISDAVAALEVTERATQLIEEAAQRSNARLANADRPAEQRSYARNERAGRTASTS